MEIKNKIFKCPPGEEEVTKNFQREIYSKNEYDRFGVRIKEGDVVLDCGANVGIFTQYALDMGASQVLAYECNESLFEYYNENITNNRTNCTMGFVGHNKYDLPKIFKQHNIDKIDFAKIDIEGDEWSMFKEMKVDDIKKVKKWAIEFHTLQNNTNISEKDKKIKLQWLLDIIEKFCLNGFNVKYQHIHKEWDIVHLFAWRENQKAFIQLPSN